MGGCDEFGFSASSPTKEHLLREEYPDLKEKWIAYNVHCSNFSSATEELKSFGIIKRFLNPKKYDRVLADWDETKNLYEVALKEYMILEKLLWNY